MNKQVQPLTDEELSAMCVEEQIIALSKTNYGQLPMMEELFKQFESPLGLALSEYTSVKSEVVLKSFEYMSCADALAEFSAPSLFAVVTADPWGGELAIMAESGLLATMLQIMLGGKPSSARAKERSFTSIEKRIATKFYDVVLHELSRTFTDVTPVSFRINTLQEDPEELDFAPLDSACVKVVLQVLLEGQSGQVVLILPYIAFESASGAFAQPFHGGDIGSENGWRGAIVKSLQGTDVELTAIMQEMTSPLHEMLAWRVGQVLDIGMDVEHEVLVNCSGKQMFRAAMGCRKNGSVALRITETLSEVDG